MGHENVSRSSRQRPNKSQSTKEKVHMIRNEENLFTKKLQKYSVNNREAPLF
jgi:hypothetical protein